MKFLVDTFAQPHVDHLIVNRGFHDYLRYLRSHEHAFPASAFAFASATWHWDVNDHRCLHDSWVEELRVRELTAGHDTAKRSVRVDVRLLGPYHDGFTNLEYVDVLTYHLHLPSPSSAPHGEVATHGDWLVDETTLKDGHVLHEIRFGDGAHWTIECIDILYRWTPLPLQEQPG